MLPCPAEMKFTTYQIQFFEQKIFFSILYIYQKILSKNVDFLPFCVRASKQEGKKTEGGGRRLIFVASAQRRWGSHDLSCPFSSSRLIYLCPLNFLGPTSCIFLADKKGGACSVRPSLKERRYVGQGTQKKEFFCHICGEGEGERSLALHRGRRKKKVRPVFWALGLDVVQFERMRGRRKQKKGTDEEKEEHFQLEDVRFNKRGWIGMPCNRESRYGQSGRSINPRRRFP